MAGDQLRSEIRSDNASHPGDADHQSIGHRGRCRFGGQIESGRSGHVTERAREGTHGSGIEMRAGAALQLFHRIGGVREGRYARLVVMASNASTTETIRASIGIASPVRLSGKPFPSIRS